jgi:hypothetical protein
MNHIFEYFIRILECFFKNTLPNVRGSSGTYSYYIENELCTVGQ